MVLVKLVYASASADIGFREQLSAHLYPLAQKGLLTEWHEQLVLAGADAARERHQAWRAADILLQQSRDLLHQPARAARFGGIPPRAQAAAPRLGRTVGQI